VKNAYKLPLILSLVIHVVLAAVLLFGEFTSDKPKPTPMVILNQPIKAMTVDKAAVENHVKKLQQKQADAKAAEQKRIRDLEKRAEQARKKRANEEQRIKNLEKQRKKKEKEKKIADDKAKKARAKANAAEKARKQKEAEKRKADKAAAAAKAKRLKAEAEAKKAEQLRKKKEAERKRKEAEKKRKAKEAKERAEQERLLAQQMEQEMASRQQARRHQMVSEINRFTALITQTIQRYLITDQATMQGKSCKLTITLAPSGFVTSVKTGQGSAVVCSAAKNAVLKAQTLPVSKDPEVFKEMRTISLTVVPEF